MKELTDRLLKTWKDKAVFGTTIVSVGLFLSGIFSYLLQIVLAGFLSVADYGTFNVLLSLSIILAVPNTAFVTSIIKLVSDLKVKDRFDLLTKMFWSLTKYEFILGTGLFLLIFLLRGDLGYYLKISDTTVFIFYGVFLGISFLSTASNAYLQGLLRFKAFSFYNVFLSTTRLVFPLLLVALGFGLAGIFSGMSFSIFLTFFVALLLLKKNFIAHKNENVNDLLLKAVKFTIPVLLTNIGLSLMNNIDIVLMKRYFEPETVGQYAGVMTIGKILLFGCGTIGLAMYPQIAEAHAKKDHVMRLFGKFLVLQLSVVGICAAAFIFFPQFFTLLLFGKRFLPSASFLPLYALFIGMYVMINFFVLFFLAVEKTKVWVFLSAAVLLQFVLLNVYKHGIAQVIYVDVFVAGLLLLVLVAFLLKERNGV